MTRELLHAIGTAVLFNTAKVAAAILVLDYAAPLTYR